MSFTSLEFVLFLAFTAGLVGLAHNLSHQRRVLILLSYAYYLTFGLAGIFLITLTALVDFTVARRLAVSVDVQARKRWLWVSLTTNIGVLAALKYAVPVLEAAKASLNLLTLNTIPLAGVLLPVGLSYFTLASMSYALDVYYERTEATDDFSEYLSYVVFFPKLVAGPIVRAAELLPQLREGVRISAQNLETGCVYFLVGAVKKLVIADQLAGHVGMILSAPNQYDAFTLLQGMLGYTVQIYADFSGYSDMAIGCARMMGYRFPQNFMMPYSSVNIVEFWRRWHMTLSTWLRDYLFLPLELSSRAARNANVRVSRNIIITMLVCGIWHGASWNFFLWGALHGVALAANLVYGNLRRPARVQTLPTFRLGYLASRALTLAVVMGGWILFGTETPARALEYLERMLTWRTDGIALGSPYILPLVGVVTLAHLIISKDCNLNEKLPTYATPVRVVAYSALLLALASLVPGDAVPFVYVQF